MTLVSGVALVVGGSRGVGRATALELAREGADVAILYRQDEEAADKVCAEIRALGRRAWAHRCDIAEPEEVRAAFTASETALGPAGIIVTSAGAQAPESYVHDQPPETFWRFATVDLGGTYNVIHHAVRALRRAGGGCLVAVTSIATQMVPPRNSSGAATKSANEALIKVVAREEARHGIRANAVAIGLTDTDMLKPTFEAWGEAATRKVLAAIPLGRIGQPQEVAQLIAYLADEKAAYVTGKVFQIDGGQFIGG